jgi:hypothetical protein
VIKALAYPSILETYNIERQAIAAQLVTLSNDMLRRHIAFCMTLVVRPPGFTLDKLLEFVNILREESQK